MNTSRRDFLQSSLSSIAGLTIVGFVSPLLFAGCSDPTSSSTDTGTSMMVDVSLLDASGKAIRTSSPSGRPLLVIRREGERFVTLYLECTHAGCSGDDLSNSTSGIRCACHGSTFDLDGNVTGGPASSDLTSFTTVYDSSAKQVTITF